MALGKPVVATGYSGNMDFMTPMNSFLVDYKLTTLKQAVGPYPAGACWADPDVEHAARLIGEVLDDPERARQVGRLRRRGHRTKLLGRSRRGGDPQAARVPRLRVCRSRRAPWPAAGLATICAINPRMPGRQPEVYKTLGREPLQERPQLAGVPRRNLGTREKKKRGVGRTEAELGGLWQGGSALTPS